VSGSTAALIADDVDRGLLLLQLHDDVITLTSFTAGHDVTALSPFSEQPTLRIRYTHKRRIYGIPKKYNELPSTFRRRSKSSPSSLPCSLLLPPNHQLIKRRTNNPW